ncbi:MAG: methionyl-tRNA formyltransferase [Candidatus Hydrogenedentes bacterium]|nr:methionyl-tRNA formyltransferase [Candidatus Hydrogenedentota bacterium]
MRIVVAGSGRLGASVLVPLLESGHAVIGLIQNGRLTRGFDRRLAMLRTRLFASLDQPLGLAQRQRIPVIWLDTMSETELHPLRELAPDLIVTCGFGIILKRPVLDLPKVGCMNIHSSLLPKHRGPMPFAHVILSDERESGVTFHVTEEAIDSGDILAQHAFALTPDDTAERVYQKACAVVMEHVVEVINRIESDGLSGEAQSADAATYDKGLKSEDVFIDWSRPAQEIDRLVRAGNPVRYARFMDGDTVVQVVESTFDTAPVPDAPGTLIAATPDARIATGQGSLTFRTAFVERRAFWLRPVAWKPPARGTRLS